MNDQQPPPLPGGTPAVLLEGLTRHFGRKKAVVDLDLRVEEGEFFGFLGPNGAGKSTTIKMMCGLLRPTLGRALVLGRDAERESLEVRRSIGVLPEEVALYERLTPVEMLWVTGRLHGLADHQITLRTGRLMDLMEISRAERGKIILDFSMGMRKKIALACALIHGPRLLFLDEPFNGIDAVTVRAIRSVLQDAVARGVTIFFSSHILELVERLCTRMAIITEGRLRVCGTLEEIRAQAGHGPESTLEDIFVHLAGGERETAGGLEFLG